LEARMADEDLFGEDYLFFYDDDASEASVTRDVDAILKLLDLPPGSSILEVGCGEGRLLRELARRGYRAAGVDRSSQMIEAAMAKGTGDASAVAYFAGDVRDMKVDAPFDGAFSWYTSFGYEDDTGNLDVLRSIRSQLSRGGRFAIDVTNRDFLVRNLRETIVYERGDNFLIERLSYDTRTSRMRNDRVYVRSGVRRVTFSLRLYGFTELSDLLARAGFGSVEPFVPEGQLPAGIAPRIRLAATAI
jgi:SAM-dependent methyltransferase